MIGKQKRRPGFGQKIRIPGLLILIAALTFYGWNTYSKFTRGLPKHDPGPGTQAPVGFGQKDPKPEGPPRNRRDRRKGMQKIMDELNLTEDQQQEIREIWEQGRPKSRDEGRTRMQMMLSVLKPEQQRQAREMMRSRIQKRIQKMQEKGVSDDEIREVKGRIEERMNKFMGPPPNSSNR